MGGCKSALAGGGLQPSGTWAVGEGVTPGQGGALGDGCVGAEWVVWGRGWGHVLCVP